SNASRDLDQSAADWGGYCEGAPSWSVQNVAAPSLDGSALKVSIDGGAPYSNIHVYRTLLSDPAANVFSLNLSFRFTATTLSNQGSPSTVQAIEFGMNKWYQR